MMFLTDETIKAKSIVGDIRMKLIAKDKEITEFKEEIARLKAELSNKVDENKNFDELIKYLEKQL